MVLAALAVLVVLIGLAMWCFLAPVLPYPICVMIAEQPGYPQFQVSGLDEAEIVFEWVDRFGASQFLAVFTRQPTSAVGPVSALSLGGMDLAEPYGRVVCSSLRPDAVEFLNSHRLPGSMLYLPGQKYVTLREALSQMKKQRWQVSPVDGWRLHRGTYAGSRLAAPPTGSDPAAPSTGSGSPAPSTGSGSPAPEVVVRSKDGVELFSWRWNGRHYQRRIDGETVRVRAVVVLFADEDSGPLDSGSFPEGVFTGDRGRALLYVDGREIPVTWSRKFSQPVSLEEASRPIPVPLPAGRVWFHIVRPSLYSQGRSGSGACRGSP